MNSVRHTVFWRLALGILWASLLGGCGLLSGAGLFGEAANPNTATSDGPSRATEEPQPFAADDPLPYTVQLRVEPDDATGAALLSRFEGASLLVRQKNALPDGRLDLERRMAADTATAVKLLRSEGYYDGTAHDDVNWDVAPVRVQLTLEPGSQYTLGPSRVSYEEPVFGYPASSSAALPVALPASLPMTLPGLKPGAPAEAQAVLSAVDRLLVQVRQEGYPGAAVATTRYEIDRASRTLEAQVTVRTGPRLRMGPVRLQGAPNVRDTLAERLAPWTPGQTWWSDDLAGLLQDRLRDTGLFRTVRVEPDVPDGAPLTAAHNDGVLPLRVVALEALPRTVGGGMKYASDVGFGVQGYWEHRNIMGEGEQLRLAAPLSQERQEFSATFTKPFFGGLNQRLLAEALALNEDNEAYSQTAGLVGLGLERQFDEQLKGSVRVTAEGGRLDDALNPRTTYAMLGLPLRLAHDSTDNLLNPSRGWRWQASVAPYTGYYASSSFTAVRLWGEASAYVAPLAGDRLVLAARVAAGSLAGAGAMDLPPSLRFYAGGGGSVRGYKYRSLGAKDVNGEPVGGRSVTEVGLEARWRLTETFGLVPFVDGGAVYDDLVPRFGRDMYWGAGLGLRYHSPIGPVRLDVALPLRSAPNGSTYQIYISIGQAF